MTVGAEELKYRPLLRSGEILEALPALIITQHAGGGKANQYFMRGFNLDHGTNIAIFLDDAKLKHRKSDWNRRVTKLTQMFSSLKNAVISSKTN